VHDWRLGLAGQLCIEDFVGVGAKIGVSRHPSQKVRPTLPSTIEKLRLVDQRGAIAHGLRRCLGRVLELLASARKWNPGKICATAGLLAELLELFLFVSFTAHPDELGMGVLCRPRLGPLTTRNREPLLSEMLTSEVIGQVRGGKNQGVVGKAEHGWGA